MEKLQLLLEHMGHPPKPESDRASHLKIAECRETITRAACTWLLFKCARFVGKKEGSARVAAISPFLKSYKGWTQTAPDKTCLPLSFVRWCGLTVSEEAEALAASTAVFTP